ncbi:hypothetical protein Q5P01_006926 [Channa striata]|uniref:C-type lectin domain-containing protein n=1 Tax=Channa striata TaxID=64152 RepID=A0AA88NC67_CHASR|nr:hypothetical protein Q5P01_006926 [Channa striata]
MMTAKTSILFLLHLPLLSSSVFGLTSVLVKQFWQVQYSCTWQEAQQFCRCLNYNADLATFYHQTDVDNVYLQRYYAWVGLAIRPYVGSWSWTDGLPLDTGFHPFHWWNQQNPPYGNCAFVTDQKWFGATDCGQYNFFICSKDDNYFFINQSKTWPDARQYCKDFYDDLAIIRQNNELDSAVNPQEFPLWIGLRRDGETWKWSRGLSDYRNWAPNPTGDYGDCVTMSSLSKTMTNQSCSTRYPFVCYRHNLVLVKENKTWEEAMQYCKDLSNNNNRYQLVSVQPGDEYDYMMNKVVEADTDEVWSGLRFLAGYWVWVNGADMSLPDLPACPVPWQYCGAFSKNYTGTLETRDCLDKKNFLCYSQW